MDDFAPAAACDLSDSSAYGVLGHWIRYSLEEASGQRVAQAQSSTLQTRDGPPGVVHPLRPGRAENSDRLTRGGYYKQCHLLT